jgi:FkbM family methyltransferase
MKIAIIDPLGLCYDGSTLENHGLGGSESAVILISKHLTDLGCSVTVFNNCRDSNRSSPGIYNSVRYIDNSDATSHLEIYDIVIVSRTAIPFVNNVYPFIKTATLKILWLHDTFIEGDHLVEQLALTGKIDYIFTLSDWHTTYILNSTHGPKRNFEVLKKKIFQTRNGAVNWLDEVDLKKKDKNHFVYNASATKGMLPLVELIWPEIKKKLPKAKLTVIGGYYRFREGARPDEQENTVATLAQRQDLKDLDITFTGVIPQSEIAKILASSWMMLYPGAFPETFGISTLESLLYKTPLVTTRFGALEETAVDQACYLIDYAIEPNVLFPHINKEKQIEKFLNTFFQAYATPYLHQQKQNYCDIVKDVAGWDTVALQWKQFFYSATNNFLPVGEYRQVTRINDKVRRVFGKTAIMPVDRMYRSYGDQQRIIVISPFWNAEKYINNCILSVAQQDYNNYLQILIDDGSTDQSALVAQETINSLPDQIKNKFIIIKNDQNVGAIANQMFCRKYCKENDIVMLLDGDDWLVNNNTLFHYYNDIYNQGYEFTYGSMQSVADNIPLIAQDYPQDIKDKKSYRTFHFNWKIPYTHLRTVLGKYFLNLDLEKFKVTGKWMKAGADNPLFYELIEQIDSKKIYCNKEIVYNYNDANPLNDYKVRSKEQNQNAALSYKKPNTMNKTILVAIPTNKYIEPETFKSIWNLIVPEGYILDFQYFYGYQIDQIRNLIADWSKNYDFLLSVDSDIVLPSDALVKMLAVDGDIVSGLYIQRIPEKQIVELYMTGDNGGCINIPYSLLENKGIVEVVACGMGCALIKGQVFQKLSYPHYYYKSSINHNDTVSEDVYFCTKARQQGFKIWAETSVVCDHIGNTSFTVETPIKKHIKQVAQQNLLPGESIEYLESLEITPQVVYDIGSCVLHWQRHAKRIWKESKIYLFEANQDVKFLYDASDQDYYLGIVTDQDNKKVNFYKDPMNLGGNSYYRENTIYYNESHAISEIGNTLDTIVKENNWPLPDLIKINTQGSELDIIKGANLCLSKCTDVILKCQHEEYNKGAPMIGLVKEYMKSKGFELVANFYKAEVDGNYHFKKIKKSKIVYKSGKLKISN